MRSAAVSEVHVSQPLKVAKASQRAGLHGVTVDEVRCGVVVFIVVFSAISSYKESRPGFFQYVF